ncbi:MAG: FtsH protease activity modulator HflK [Rickettsiales bacterium]
MARIIPLFHQNPWGPPPGNDNRGGQRRPSGPDHGDMDELLQRMKRRWSGGGNNGGKDKNASFGGAALLGLALLALFVGQDMFYIIDEGHRGIVRRFGKPLEDSSGAPVLKEPGPHFKFPAPIDRIVKVRTDEIRKEEIGFESLTYVSRTGLSSQEKSRLNESLMLTGDENIIDVKLVVQWKIKDPVQYSFNVRDEYGESSVKMAAESAIREVLGGMNYTDAIVGEGRTKIESEMKEELQGTLDSYHMGVLITSVDLRHIDPPEEVIDAFRDVQTAKANKETMINQAQAYSNDVLPKAGGQAERALQQAMAYKEEKINVAKGESQRFLSVYTEYVKARDVTRKRMYMETMEKMLSSMDKTLVDPHISEKGGGVVPYLPLGDKARVSTAVSAPAQQQ